jgi:glycosyltransferase involved in cell wall biosynthesis
MDCFVLPSFYEGLPVVAVEAQATGLPCVMSSEITKEAGIINYDFVDLSANKAEWINKILKYKNFIRRDTKDALYEAGYDVRNEAIKLQNYYLNLACNI